jgi:WD40 repeat protein
MLHVLFGVVIALLILVGTAYYLANSANGKHKISEEKKTVEVKKKKPSVPKKKKFTSAKSSKQRKKKDQMLPTHEKFSHAIKGHSQNIICFAISPNKKWIATASEDQSVRITELENTVSGSSARAPLFFRINMNGDSITSLSWAADSLTVIGSSELTREVYFFRMRKKKDNDNEKSASSGFKYELIELKKRRFQTNHMGVIQSCAIDTAYSTPIIVTGCDHKSDKQFLVWDSKSGQKVGQIPNKSCSNGGAILSHDGHFIANASTSSSEVKIFEVVRKKEKGQAEPVFQSISNKAAMTLASGAHTSNVNSVCFGPHDANVASGVSDRVVTAGADGHLVLWDIDVRFDLKADPEIVCKINVGFPLKFCMISSNGKKIACVDNSDNIHFYMVEIVKSSIKTSERALKKINVIQNEGTTGGNIKQITFSNYEGTKMTVLNENSKHAFIWNC